MDTLPVADREGACLPDDRLPQYVLVKQGLRLKVSRSRFRSPVSKEVKRGVIHSFSAAARKRMLCRCAEIDWEKSGNGLFVTYTYPDGKIDTSIEERKQHRGVIHRDVELYCGRHVAAIWKVEWLPRLTGDCLGRVAPHVHVLYFDVAYISYGFLRERWAKAIGHKGYVNVHGEQLSVGDMCSVYMAKYCAKESSPYRLDKVPYRNKTGRHAGWLRRNLIPWHTVHAEALPSKEVFDMLMERATKILPYLDQYYGDGFTLLGDEADKLFRELQGKID